MTPGSPYARAVAAERTRLQALLDGRTNPDGTAKPGLKNNVRVIRARLAKLPAVSDEPGHV